MGVTYIGSGYPMVHEARVMVMDGKLGGPASSMSSIHLNGWQTAIEAAGNVQAARSTDPRK